MHLIESSGGSQPFNEAGASDLKRCGKNAETFSDLKEIENTENK